MAVENREKRDLVLPPFTYAYMQDVTKGVLKVYTGPTVINPTAQEVPVVYDPKSATFRRCDLLEDALRKAPVTVEGFYCVLLNPAKNRIQPQEGTAQAAPDLDIGRKVIIPGPSTFALWPGQVAEVIRGHHLRSNQYLLCRVYNEEQAKANWSKAIVKPAAADNTGKPGETETKIEEKVTTEPPPDLTVGRLLVIRGTQVSFYIPPTGVTVVPDGLGPDGKTNYVREALTLERLEYAILRDESGEKRYEYGPCVVFPEPTEKFLEAEGSKKFRAIELNELQGIHIKVIADYTDEKTKQAFKAGQELFITGKDTQIYYPREEHSAIKYDGKTKSFATAIPIGEARYVLNRMTGEIRTVKGPAMLLPDPRTEVIVRRVLSDKQASLWYPGNAEALEYNRSLRQIMASVPTTRGAISDGDYERNTKGASKRLSTRGMTLESNAAPVALAAASFMEASNVSREQGYVGDEFSRASTYTQPRTIQLDTKYQGAPTIDVWTGYAVMVVGKNGKRRVEVGPCTLVLDYDESLEVLELSTGKPKNTDNLLRTVYLRVENNQVADIVKVETSDHVQVDLKLSYRVNFEGDQMKWFTVENYVKLMCDHIRSVLKGKVKQVRVEEFYSGSTEILRDTILGAMADVATEGSKAKMGRKGMVFPANGLHVTDVEVLGVTISDERIRAMLDGSQQDVVRTNIEVSGLKRRLEFTKTTHSIAREEDEVKAETERVRNKLALERLAVELEMTLTRLGHELKEAEESKKINEMRRLDNEAAFAFDLDKSKRVKEQELVINEKTQAQRIEMLKAEALSTIDRFKAAQGGFSEALLALSNNETMQKVAQAWSIQRVIGGENVSEALARVFAGTPLAGLVRKMVEEQKTLPTK